MQRLRISFGTVSSRAISYRCQTNFTRVRRAAFVERVPYPGAVRGFDNCVSDLLSIKWVVCDLLSQTSTPRGIGYSIQTSSLTEQLLIQVNIHENQLRFQSIARSIEWAYSCFVCVAFALGIAFCAAMGIVRVVEKLGEAEMRRMACGQLVDLP
jgi:hypothetical protein